MGGRGSVAFEFAAETEARGVSGAEDLYCNFFSWLATKFVVTKRGRGGNKGCKWDLRLRGSPL